MPFTYSRYSVPPGLAGTQATVQAIQHLIIEGTVNEQVRLTAVDAIRSCPNKDKECEAKALFDWIKYNIRFVNDPWGAELLHHADAILLNGVGDCDDQVILGGSLLRSVGIPVRIVIIGVDPSAPDLFSHIYLHAYVRGAGWVGFDPSVPGSTFGWEPQQYARKQIIEIRE